MKFALLLALLGTAHAAPIIMVDPIPVNGLGNWQFSFPFDGFVTLFAAGDDGTNFVSFNYNSSNPATFGFYGLNTTAAGHNHSAPCGTCSASINDIAVSSHFDVFLGNGGGSLNDC